MYQILSPVLLTIFNRPDTTQRVFAQIREGRPRKLYVAADGPRPDREQEKTLCEQTRAVIQVDWDCEVHYLYRTENLGCKLGMSGAIKWFFEHEPEGIILEDDCLPGEGFFRFCDTLLEKFRHDTRIAHIAGTNLSRGKTFGSASYYFSKYTFIWGWASWRRVWENYDEKLALLDDFLGQDLFRYVYEQKSASNFLTHNLNLVKTDAISTWDYQYSFLNFWNNRLCICPNVNLISNIGFDMRGTHTHDKSNKFAALPIADLTEITHPKFFVPILDADYEVFRSEQQSTSARIRSKIARVLKRLLSR